METYTLLLQSAYTTNRSGSNTGAYTYFVNWGGIIPDKYKDRKFEVSFTFYSTPQSTNQDITQIAVNFNGSQQIYDQNTTKTNIIGVAYPVVYSQNGSTEYSFLIADANTNSSFVCGYPSSNSITVNLYENATYLTAPNPVNTDYSLFLKFKLI